MVAGQRDDRRFDQEIVIVSGGSIGPVEPVDVVVDLACRIDDIAHDQDEVAAGIGGRGDGRTDDILRGILLTGVPDHQEALGIGAVDDQPLGELVGRQAGVGPSGGLRPPGARPGGPLGVGPDLLHPGLAQLIDEPVAGSTQSVVDRVDQGTRRDPGQTAPASGVVPQEAFGGPPVRRLGI